VKGDHERLGRPLALVVARPRADRVHPAQVGLGLGVQLRVAVHLLKKTKYQTNLYEETQDKKIKKEKINIILKIFI
jgi:hypothetical protein